MATCWQLFDCKCCIPCHEHCTDKLIDYWQKTLTLLSDKIDSKLTMWLLLRDCLYMTDSAWRYVDDCLTVNTPYYWLTGNILSVTVFWVWLRRLTIDSGADTCWQYRTTGDHPVICQSWRWLATTQTLLPCQLAAERTFQLTPGFDGWVLTVVQTLAGS
jgi:hypothetical protein